VNSHEIPLEPELTPATLKLIRALLNDPTLSSTAILILDLTAQQPALSSWIHGHNPSTPEHFLEIINAYIEQQIQKHGHIYTFGRYLEDRVIYQTPQFQTTRPRSVHLGIDLGAPAGTPIHALLDGYIHSFRDNQALGDYGPTLILAHPNHGFSGPPENPWPEVIYTLYGHLSQSDLKRWTVGTPIGAGELIGQIGHSDENGGWRPHVHCQLILDITYGNPNLGDFPGVCTLDEVPHMRRVCPDLATLFSEHSE
jgi:murein DD-endopeptidase MepM/ murein hydrolase activator NlpD